MNYINKKSIIISLVLVVFAITAICIRIDMESKTYFSYKIGGLQNKVSDISDDTENMPVTRQTAVILSEIKANINEVYFRPSRLPALNNNFSDYTIWQQTFKDSKVPAALLDTPLNTLLNYFSILQQAANLTDNKTGGCGTIGYAKEPYPIAYKFLSTNNKKDMPYEKYLASFEGIGHINLIKVIPIISNEKNKFKYLIELEILEGTPTGGTAFNYYIGEMTIVNENNKYLIDSLDLTPEDFFCAPYHGWSHKAESYVEVVYGNWAGLIMKQYAPSQDDFTKEIIIDGVDGKKYMFRFAKLTNGTDFLINTFVENKGEWVLVDLDIKRQQDNPIEVK